MAATHFSGPVLTTPTETHIALPGVDNNDVDIGDAAFVRLTSTVGASLNGIVSSQPPGTPIIIWYDDPGEAFGQLSVSKEDPGSAPAHRIAANVTIKSNAGLWFIYSSAISRWIPLGDVP